MGKKKESIYIQGICVICNSGKQQSKGVSKYKSSKGKRIYKNICTNCTRLKHRIHKKEYCEGCNFIPKHGCQLDVDHIDGNKDNNLLENLKTLCANCHRLKTYNNKDWES